VSETLRSNGFRGDIRECNDGLFRIEEGGKDVYEFVVNTCAPVDGFLVEGVYGGDL
jgi:hypothetical protein